VTYDTAAALGAAVMKVHSSSSGLKVEAASLYGRRDAQPPKVKIPFAEYVFRDIRVHEVLPVTIS